VVKDDEEDFNQTMGEGQRVLMATLALTEAEERFHLSLRSVISISVSGLKLI
jgi:hypothetical protein